MLEVSKGVVVEVSAQAAQILARSQRNLRDLPYRTLSFTPQSFSMEVSRYCLNLAA